jgi:hypothetical protein
VFSVLQPVAELQLARGGIRLANVLNSIFAQPSMAEYVVPRDIFRANEPVREALEQIIADW